MLSRSAQQACRLANPESIAIADNSNMAAIDDSIGVMRAALEEHKAKFGNRTLIVFSQGAQMAP